MIYYIQRNKSTTPGGTPGGWITQEAGRWHNLDEAKAALLELSAVPLSDQLPPCDQLPPLNLPQHYYRIIGVSVVYYPPDNKWHAEPA